MGPWLAGLCSPCPHGKRKSRWDNIWDPGTRPRPIPHSCKLSLSTWKGKIVISTPWGPLTFALSCNSTSHPPVRYSQSTVDSSPRRIPALVRTTAVPSWNIPDTHHTEGQENWSRRAARRCWLVGDAGPSRHARGPSIPSPARRPTEEKRQQHSPRPRWPPSGEEIRHHEWNVGRVGAARLCGRAAS